MKQMSIAISDGVLALAACWAVFVLKTNHIYASFGFAFMAIAATLGVTRFGTSHPTTLIIEAHQGATWLTSVGGLALIAIDYHQGNPQQKTVFSNIALFLMIIAPILVILKPMNILGKKQQGFFTSAVSVIAMLSMLASGVMHWNPACILAVVSFAIAGAIGTTGSLLGVLRVNWFHYFIAFANIVFVEAFQYKPNLM